MSWHEKRFEDGPKKVCVNCVSCGRAMFFPKCKAGRYRTCSEECRVFEKVLRDKQRERSCLECGKSFVPRLTQINAGTGNHCSRACSRDTRLIPSLTPEAQEKRLRSYMNGMKEGRIIHKSGEENPLWSGGVSESLRRRKESGKIAESVRKYRRENPEKVREYSMRRKSRKFGRLPKGTISRLLKLQSNKCVICRCSLGAGYHMDHIMPLAKGGKHEAENIQILCPTCNVRKSDKDPIAYMQERGYLL